MSFPGKPEDETEIPTLIVVIISCVILGFVIYKRIKYG